CRNQRAQSGGQLQRHTQPDVSNVPLDIEGRGRRRSGNHANQAHADGLVHGQAIIERHQRSQNYTTADAGQGAEAAHQETYYDQDDEGFQGHEALSRSVMNSPCWPARASARKTEPTETSTTTITMTTSRGTGSRPISAPSITAMIGTTSAVVASW